VGTLATDMVALVSCVMGFHNVGSQIIDHDCLSFDQTVMTQSSRLKFKIYCLI